MQQSKAGYQKTGKKQFDLVNLSRLRRNIDSSLGSLVKNKLNFDYELNSLIDDWVSYKRVCWFLWK